MRTAGVIGAGAWGTALAQVCARAGLGVRLWAREPDLARAINATRQNPAYLPGVDLDPGVMATGRPADLADADLILAVTPAQHLRASLTLFAPCLASAAPVVLCAKGVEAGSLKLMSQVLAETLPAARLAVLSGPSLAGEVARGLPTAVTLAAGDLRLAETLARRIATPAFRPYVSDDVIGAEVGGAVKNVLAIACGIVEGRGLGRSAHAALITRGFAELTRLAVALGGEAETVAGLCGLGDLVLTCSSPQSRNMSVGLAMGRGASLAEALAGKRTVAEGVASAPAVRDLAARLGVETPICDAVCAILAGEIDVDPAIATLLAAPSKRNPDTPGATIKGDQVMTVYVMMCVDKPESLALRMANRPDHLAYMATQQAAIRAAGPMLGETGEMCGSLIILEAPDLAAARALNAADPYTLAGLFERVEIHAWRQSVGPTI